MKKIKTTKDLISIDCGLFAAKSKDKKLANS